MTIITSKIGELILENHPRATDLNRALKALILAVKTQAEATTDKEHQGIFYSNSLFDDATDNIFYSIHVGRIADRSDFYAELRFAHNATQLYTGLIVSPADVQSVGETTGQYAIQVMNNITFPRVLTHLLYRAMTKVLGEIEGGLDTLKNVATLLN